jgi:hypothetical protein
MGEPVNPAGTAVETAVSQSHHSHGYPAAKSVDPAAANIYGNKLH